MANNIVVNPTYEVAIRLTEPTHNYFDTTNVGVVVFFVCVGLFVAWCWCTEENKKVRGKRE